MVNRVSVYFSTKAFLSAFVAFVLFFSACKENTILPPDLVPPIDNINTFQSDTFSLVTHGIYQDSILTGGSIGSISVAKNSNFLHALGTLYNHPSYGFTKAAVHVEVVPPTANYTHKGYSPIFDSIVLTLPFVNSFGDSVSGDEQYFVVYRSLKKLSKDSAQYEFTKDSFDISQPPMGSYTMNYNTIRKDTSGKLMRIKLAGWFADSLKAQMDLLSSGGATSSYDKFLEWWKGFYITGISTQGSALGYFNTYGTRMNVYYRYYKDSALTDIDTTVDVFGFEPNYCNRFNSIERRYSGSVASQFLNTGKPNGDSLLFIQNLPGLAAEFRFPHLTQLERILINRAELNVYSAVPITDMSDTLKYGLVPRFQVFRNENGTDRLITEYASLGTGFIDGKRREVTVDGKKYIGYKILLTETIQNLIAKKDTNIRIRIMGLSDNAPAAYGTTLKGSASAVDSLRPKLSLIYTKY